MENPNAGTEWTFVIDTNEYAGNFEREMCAYVTGCVGDCGVGVEFAELARKELLDDIWKAFDAAVANVPDEHGCARPVTIWENPNWFNDGMGTEYRVDDTDEAKQLKGYVKEIEDYYMPLIKKTKGYLKLLEKGEKVNNWTIKDCKRDIANKEKEIAKAKALKRVTRHPAYNSVGIWFETKPTLELIAVMKERAAKFAAAKRAHGESWEKNFKLTIEGFRLIQHKRTETSTNV